MRRHPVHINAGLGVILSLIFASAATASAPVAAAKSGDTATLRKLLRQGVNPNSHDGEGISTLEWAAAKGRIAEVKTLLRAHGAVDGAYTRMKFTPLMRASNFGFANVAALLIAHGAKVNARTTRGYTSLDYAMLENHADVGALLVRRGAKRGLGIGQRHPEAFCNIAAAAGFHEIDGDFMLAQRDRAPR